MNKIWQKGSKITINTKVENFLSADDIVLDQKIAVYDIYGSLGHLAGLLDAKIVTIAEYAKIKKGLQEILKLAMAGQLEIKVTDEDIHTVVENKLQQEIGAVAGKLHTMRSRNDQVAVDLKLCSKQELLDIMEAVLDLAAGFLKFANQHKSVAMPGYTHMRPAMISSVGLWAESFTASLLDDFSLLKNSYDLNNQSPLGSAAGYGTPLPLNREVAAKALGFPRVQNNYLYCQNSRGKVELAIIHSLLQVMMTINKFSTDLLIFTMDDKQYFKLPDSFLTGSSIMAQKKNYDALELLRAKQASLSANYQHVVALVNSLPSGYNRDFQELKKPLFLGFDTAQESVQICHEVISNLKVNKPALQNSITEELLVTNEVYKLVKEGMAFRTAYKKIGEQYIQKKLKVESNFSVPSINANKYKSVINTDSKLIGKEQKTFKLAIHKLA